MKLLSILISLALERFFPQFNGHRCWAWLNRYVKWWQGYGSEASWWQSHWALLLVMLPVLILLALLCALLDRLLFGLLGFVFSTAVL